MEVFAGSINEQYGIYKNHCCGDELVVCKGIIFPNCNMHAEIVTRWQLLVSIPRGPLGRPEPTGNAPNSGNPAA
jgi:hypothetical protein